MVAMAAMLMFMTDHHGERDLVVQVMHDFGADWQIRHDPETDIWIAVQLPGSGAAAGSRRLQHRRAGSEARSRAIQP